jgi:hypothetical protein
VISLSEPPQKAILREPDEGGDASKTCFTGEPKYRKKIGTGESAALRGETGPASRGIARELPVRADAVAGVGFLKSARFGILANFRGGTPSEDGRRLVAW